MSRDVLDLIDRIGKQENKITEKVFVSPVFYNTRIATSVERIIYSFDIKSVEPGWYKFQPVNTKRARMIGKADLDEIHQYLQFLPKVRLILVFKNHKAYYGVPLKGNKHGFEVSELLPVYLFDDMATDLSKIICRFDGANLWYDSLDFSGDPAKTDYLIESLKKLRDPKWVKYTGLTLEEKIAYAIKHTYEKKISEESKKTKLQRDVEFAGGKFLESKERSDHIYVTYEVDGAKFSTIVSKDPNHRVITAGICLTDHDTGRAGDTDYDLKALVSVIREGQRTNQIHRNIIL